MNSLKIGIIGVFILLPFLFLASVQIRQYQESTKTHAIVEKAAERAMRDGVFALKTFSRFSYDAEQSKKIEIAEKETIDSINRSFAYALNIRTESGVAALKKDIRLIGFVAYDALILHDQKTGERLEIPLYQLEIRGDRVTALKRNTKELVDPADGKDSRIEKILTDLLRPYAGENQVILPEHRSTLFGNDYTDVGVFMVVKGDPLQIGEERNYFKIGKVSLSERKIAEPESGDATDPVAGP